MTAFFIGDVALDEYYTADRWPGRADKGMVTEMPAEAGGSIANAAVVHAALGGATEFISLLNDSPLSRRLVADLRANDVGVAHMLTDPAIPESRNLIFLVDGEHIVLTVEMGQQPMWLPAATLAALRAPGFLYTTLYRARRLHCRIGGEVLAQARLLADLRAHGRRTISTSMSAAAARRICPIWPGPKPSSSIRWAFAPPLGMTICRLLAAGCARHDCHGWFAPWQATGPRQAMARRSFAPGVIRSMWST
ncbi:carbohydrate kinase family protein [Mesorhizobium sp. M8A.F.Ca.ET.057.01.1.1]|nr:MULTISPECIES: carbohydrate kinase family protein [unclassified Mesorhizobium]AZO57428.1 carbohydrate kinase family protein [Mesorhizobium sp. M8A.F.Ca.ET.057.01.1.1]RWE42339.1 MAG: carbohydrate kinase family protein [Mesorhizobium sp.]